MFNGAKEVLKACQCHSEARYTGWLKVTGHSILLESLWLI